MIRRILANTLCRWRGHRFRERMDYYAPSAFPIRLDVGCCVRCGYNPDSGEAA